MFYNSLYSIALFSILLVKLASCSEVFVSSYFGLTQSIKGQDCGYFARKIGACQPRSKRVFWVSIVVA